ncbi:MAG: pyridoxamine 5'-phosphate oxidase family protein [Chloroflexi bacterium]|nr:pyridoxamine 5'-phosphate oxidase family protein [Chloroflexota bacterium]
MIELTEEMQTAVNSALADKVSCLIATASADGKPSIGYRGSMLAFTASSLAYWERTYRRGIENVESNPHVVVLYRNPETRQAWKFFGQASIYRNGATRDDVMARVVQAELDRDPDSKGCAVVIELDRVESMQGEVLMEA